MIYWRPNKFGRVSKCTCSEDMVGKGRCNHIPGYTYLGLDKQQVEMRCLEVLSSLTENNKTRKENFISFSPDEELPQDVAHGMERKFISKTTRAYCKIDNIAECKTSGLSEELSDITFQYIRNIYYHAKYTTRAFYDENNNDTRYNCCVSKNFLFKNESVVTFEDILTSEEYLEFKKNPSPSSQFDFLVEKISGETGMSEEHVHSYLMHQFISDLLISNPDGNLRNLAVVKKVQKFKDSESGEWRYGDTFRQCPFFDHGLALFANYKKFPIDVSMESNMRKVMFRPFGVWEDPKVFKSCKGLTREEMTELLKSKIRPNEKLQIDVKALERRLKSYENHLYDEKYVNRSKNAILVGLKYLDTDLWEDVS